MKYKYSISFFIPAYNEEGNLERISQDILSFLKKNYLKYELVIVANVSKDKTSEIARKIAKKTNNVRVIQQEKFVGYGVQFRTGFENSSNELIAYTDSDRQFDINEMHNFMKFIDEYDMVIGYRKNRKDKKMRLFYSWIYNLALHVLVGIPFKDVDCAFKVVHKRVIDKIKPLSCVISADSELVAKAIAHGFKIKQIPVTHYPRVAGQSQAEIGRMGFFSFVKPSIMWNLFIEAIKLRREIRG